MRGWHLRGLQAHLGNMNAVLIVRVPYSAFLGINSVCYWRYLMYFVELNSILKRTSSFQIFQKFTQLRMCSRHSRFFIRTGPQSSSPIWAEAIVSHSGTRAGASSAVPLWWGLHLGLFLLLSTTGVFPDISRLLRAWERD